MNRLAAFLLPIPLTVIVGLVAACGEHKATIIGPGVYVKQAPTGNYIACAMVVPQDATQDARCYP